MSVVKKSFLGNSISLDANEYPTPSLATFLRDALHEVGCFTEQVLERNEKYCVVRYMFESRLVAAEISWFESEDDDYSSDCVLELDKSFVKEWWDVLKAYMLPKYNAACLDNYKFESEAYSWGPVTDKRRQRIAKDCSAEIQAIFDQLG